MAESAQDPSEPIDVRKVRYLVRLMKRYDLTDLNISDGQVHIRLRRRGPEAALPVQSFTPASGPPAANPAYSFAPQYTAPAGAPRPDASAPEPPPTVQGIVIKSPMVGTYYSSSSPDAPPFVSIGSVVQPDSTVCIIEAMKVFTDIPAGVSGKISEILVKSGQAVEFDQPLFRVLPS